MYMRDSSPRLNGLTPSDVPDDPELQKILQHFKPRKFRNMKGYLYRMTDTHKLFVVVYDHSAEGLLMGAAKSRTIQKYTALQTDGVKDGLLKIAKMAAEDLHTWAVASSYAAITMRTDLGISGVPGLDEAAACGNASAR